MTVSAKIATRKVDLMPLDLQVGRVRFVAAEVPVQRSPFVLVHYRLDGELQPLAHRIDLDKRIFLDPLESGSAEDARLVAERISDHLVAAG